jgi:5-methylcytosine-specific restriction endonuclease McrA
VKDSFAIIAALALRDGAVCYIDGQPEDPDDPFEIEHVVPISAGGGGDLNDLSNLRLAHRSCNRTKGTNAVVSK